LEKFKRADDYKTLDAFVESLGFHGAGYDWQLVDNLTATQILIDILYRDLVHGLPTMPLPDSAILAAEIIQLFDSKARCYTNWTSMNGWTASITKATFERGVAFIDKQNIGLFWIAEED
jgi:hypothetical protein